MITEDPGKSLSQSITSTYKIRPSEVFRHVGGGALEGGIAGLAGGPAGAGIGALLGSIVGAVKLGTTKYVKVLEELNTITRTVIETYKEYSGTLKTVDQQMARVDRQINRDWARAMAPIVKQTADILMENKKHEQKMRLERYEATKPWLQMGIEFKQAILTPFREIREMFYTGWTKVLQGLNKLFGIKTPEGAKVPSVNLTSDMLKGLVGAGRYKGPAAAGTEFSFQKWKARYETAFPNLQKVQEGAEYKEKGYIPPVQRNARFQNYDTAPEDLQGKLPPDVLKAYTESYNYFHNTPTSPYAGSGPGGGYPLEPERPRSQMPAEKEISVLEEENRTRKGQLQGLERLKRESPKGRPAYEKQEAGIKKQIQETEAIIQQKKEALSPRSRPKEMSVNAPVTVNVTISNNAEIANAFTTALERTKAQLRSVEVKERFEEYRLKSVGTYS